MQTKLNLIPVEHLEKQQVILDSNLARIYGVPTKVFNQAVKRNASRFPEDFAFQLTREEFRHLISQIAISSSRHGGRRKLPTVFTEHGAILLGTHSDLTG